MRWIHFPRLNEIEVNAFPNFTALQMEEFISLASRSKLLHTIDLDESGDFTGTYPIIVLERSSFEPLLNLENLSILRFQSNFIMNLDDKLIGDMARAWPHLTELVLVPWLEPPTRPATTLAALIPLLTHCPRLVTLDLSLDAVVPEQFQRMEQCERGSEREWRKFELRHWVDVPDVQVASKFLAELLPTIYATLETERVNRRLPWLRGWGNSYLPWSLLGGLTMHRGLAAPSRRLVSRNSVWLGHRKGFVR